MSVGSRLASARERLGISPEELAAQTRLRVSVIRQIESDNFSVIDAEVYVRAHLRSIAQALHLDPNDIISEYVTQTGLAGVPLGSTPAGLNEELNIFDVRRRDALPARRSAMPFAIIGVVALLLAAVVTQMFLRNDGEASPIITLSAQPTTTKSHSPSPTDSKGVDPSIVTLVLKVNQRSWITVTASTGEKLLSANVNAGETRAFTDVTGLTVTIGNAPGVEVTVNGYALGVVGNGKVVVSQTYGLGSPAPVSTASASAS